jgi:hypothetical protein
LKRALRLFGTGLGNTIYGSEDKIDNITESESTFFALCLTAMVSVCFQTRSICRWLPAVQWCPSRLT